MKDNNEKIIRIVLTGGPCGGKSTAIEKINKYFTPRGYTVISVPETATELISNGIAPWNCKNPYEFQTILMTLQLKKEELALRAAKGMNKDKILMIYDRGMLDNKGYVTSEEFSSLMKDFNTNEVYERDKYDAVIQLVSAAKGAPEAYTTDNNPARKDMLKEAEELDDKMIDAWTGHPHFRVVDNSTDFEEKINRVIKEIALFIGEPEPYEIERKFVIKYPDINMLESISNCTKVEISQTYLRSYDDSERRVRARGINGFYMYYLTEKRNITPEKRIEFERRIDEREYFRLLMEADTSRKTIIKTRYCLTYNNKYYEIDIYPEWNNQAIMEIELSSLDEKIETPHFINVIKEVTDDPSYKNYSMSINMPKENNKFVRKRI